MKRPMPWSDEEEEGDDDSSSSSSSGESSSDEKEEEEKKKKGKEKKSKVISGKRKSVDFEALSKHGYKGGLSVLSVPPPKEDVKPDWSWSTGKGRPETKEEVEESYEDRQKTRDALLEGELLTHVQTRKEKKNNNLSFSQKEKRKRELGQASRGKNYVEEEKRLLRDSGVYSGFDS